MRVRAAVLVRSAFGVWGCSGAGLSLGSVTLGGGFFCVEVSIVYAVGFETAGGFSPLGALGF